jgi:NAD(P)-dependent dehydrogenase (short-subunit alcohol dehydrogenase family)
MSNNPVVLITGGLTGIGRAAAVAFAKKGANVVVADEAGKALAKELRSFGSEAEFINADVRKEDDVRAMVDKTVARFGRLDVAVNNAGTEGKPGPVIEQTPHSFAAMFETNVLGTLLSLKHELRVMQPQVQEASSIFLRPWASVARRISRSTPRANMPWKVLRSRRLSKPPRSASASMQLRLVRPKPPCSIG